MDFNGGEGVNVGDKEPGTGTHAGSGSKIRGNSMYLGLLLWGLCLGAQLTEPKPNVEEVRVVPVPRTPEGDNVQVYLMFPKSEEVKMDQPIRATMRTEGLYFGVDSDFPRAKEIYNDPQGQSLHFIIDEDPYISINEAFIDALDNNEIYSDQKFDFDLPKLKPGMHVIRAFPVRSYNESYKGDNCFLSRVFYVKSKTPADEVDLSVPFLTYNEPQGDYDYSPTEPVLLDFYISNCQLSPDGYKVRFSVDGKVVRIITQWTPFYIYGLKKGSHKIRLELLDPANKPLAGLFNNVEKTIKLK